MSAISNRGAARALLLAAATAAAAALAAAGSGGCTRKDAHAAAGKTPYPWGYHVRQGAITDFSPEAYVPTIHPKAYVSAEAVVIGDVSIAADCFVAPLAFVRGDEGHPLHIGVGSNIQDGAGLHALETEELREGKWVPIDGRRFSADGRRLKAGESSPSTGFAIWIGRFVSVAHQALVHGPAWVGDDTFVGMQAQVFNAKVGKGCVVGPRALVTGGVEVADGRLVPPGAVVTTQAQADALGPVKGSAFERLNAAVIHVNEALGHQYRSREEHLMHDDE